jgi:hypothetical protein
VYEGLKEKRELSHDGEERLSNKRPRLGENSGEGSAEAQKGLSVSLVRSWALSHCNDALPWQNPHRLLSHQAVMAVKHNHRVTGLV